MKEVLPLKQIGRIGKDMLIMLAGAKKGKQEEFDHETGKMKVVYINEGHQYNLSERLVRTKFSKKAIQFYVLCHLLPIDTNGIIMNVSIKKIASTLDVTVRTVQNLLRLYGALELMGVTKISSEYINIVLTRYKKYHLSRNEGGNGGYVKITKEWFATLLQYDHVNDLRLELRAYKDTLESKYSSRKAMQIQYSVQELKRFLPPHLQHQKAIKKTIEGIKPTFDITFNGHFALLKMKNQFDAVLKEAELKGTYTVQLKETLEDVSVSYEEKDFTDLLQLSMEYGVDSVISVLRVMEEDMTVEWTEIENLGGKVRTLLKMSLVQKMTA